MMKNPIQPIYTDEGGKQRFKHNEIVNFLLNNGPFDLNILAEKDFSNDDWEQFAQLTGYSLNGFSELSYVSDETYEAAESMANTKKSEMESRIEYLEETIKILRDCVKTATTTLFKIHPDDLQV